ncbi:MAG TPA: PDZ domain-containing protein [Opitutaceae bacterium]|jgi:serine protease Do|nr:PDZ domain-containing protein [Opitutaceae bacterium]
MIKVLGGRTLRWLALAGMAAGAARAQTSPSGEQSQQMLAKVLPAVVKIEAIRMLPNDGRMIKEEVGGSGVIISAQGHVLTNYHVAENGDYFRCYLTDGSKVDARLVGEDALTDLAVLQLDLASRPKDAAPVPLAPFGDSEQLVVGDTVFALGSPGFLTQAVTRGIVSNPSLVPPDVGQFTIRGEAVGLVVRWIFHDARIYFGNSGGPLINSRGEVVGINEISVANLAGAIPGNLARRIAGQIIAEGKVTRGWSGLSVQPRLESAGEGKGVLIADVTPGSPGAAAGLQPGDLVLAADGHAIDDPEDKAVAQFYRLEMGRLPGDRLALDFERGGRRLTAQVSLTRREPPLADDLEVHDWGAVVRDVTPELAREIHLPDTKGVWFESIQPSGPSGQSEPVLRRGDVLVAVNRQPVADAAALRTLTASLMKQAPKGVRTVLAAIRRGGEQLDVVVTLRATTEHEVTPEIRKAWLGAASQPLTPRLARRMGIQAEGGARLTRIFPGTKAAAAGLQIGDVVLALDGEPVPARRAEDADLLDRQIRQYAVGAEVNFTLWRDGQKQDVKVAMEEQPVPAAEMPWWQDEQLEFAARDLAFEDRVRLQLDPGVRGVIIENAVQAGWAALAGLQADDVVIRARGVPVASLPDLRQARDEAAKAGDSWLVMEVQRRSRTLFVEINLKPLHHETSP